MTICNIVCRNTTSISSLVHTLARLSVGCGNAILRHFHRSHAVPVNKVEVSVVMNGSNNYSKSVFIRADKNMYLFNCGEDTQRLLPEVLGDDQAQLHNIFVTYNSWSNIGGLVGLMLSLNWFNKRKSRVQLHGPSNVGEILKVMNYFSDYDVVAETNLEIASMTKRRFYDSNLTVDFIELSPQTEAVTSGRCKKSIAYLITISVNSDEKNQLATKSILVLECPTADYLESLEGLYSQMDTQPDLVIHMSPSHIVNHTLYKTFLERLSCSSTIHLMMNETTSRLCRTRAAGLTSQLHKLQGDIFPLLHPRDSPALASCKGTLDTIQAEHGLTITLASRGLDNGCSWSKSIPGDNQMQDHEVNLGLDILKAKMEQAYKGTCDVGEFPEIVFLGTGAFQHSGWRNVSSTLLQTQKDEYLLLDCGEGTLSQLYQLYGPHVSHILENLKAVFISHLHYDHHGGLFSLLEARRSHLRGLGRMDKLFVLCPNNFRKWVSLYSQNVDELYSCTQLIPHHVVDTTQQRRPDKGVTASLRQLKEALHIKEYTVVPVVHTVSSHGLVITHQDGWKLVYSGDTRPATSLIKHGYGCDILIHEATFRNEDHNLALLAKHSTIAEAVAVGEEMKARFTLLTHFGHKVPLMPSVKQEIKENVGYAFDFMKVQPRTMPLLPLLRPALEAVLHYHPHKVPRHESTVDGFENYLVNLYKSSVKKPSYKKNNHRMKKNTFK